MKVTIDGIGELRFSFEHGKDKNGTICKCEFDGEVYMAVSILAPGDQFRKDKGRRVSLARLLGRGLTYLGKPVHEFTRWQRQCIWAEYFKEHSDLKGGK